jgi:hypothetical protein
VNISACHSDCSLIIREWSSCLLQTHHNNYWVTPEACQHPPNRFAFYFSGFRCHEFDFCLFVGEAVCALRVRDCHVEVLPVTFVRIVFWFSAAGSRNTIIHLQQLWPTLVTAFWSACDVTGCFLLPMLWTNYIGQCGPTRGPRTYIFRPASHTPILVVSNFLKLKLLLFYFYHCIIFVFCLRSAMFAALCRLARESQKVGPRWCGQ